MWFIIEYQMLNMVHAKVGGMRQLGRLAFNFVWRLSRAADLQKKKYYRQKVHE
jgi:hypothetical protein